MFILEGNIGVGKSTFLNLLDKACKSVNVVQEPLQNWASQDFGMSLLENFYSDPKRWAYTMETLAMISRSREHMKAQLSTIANQVMERSMYSGHYCFTLNGYEQGFFNKVEWETYNHWVEFLFTQECKPPQGFIYLESDPEVCHKRMAKRNRDGEQNVPLSYLEQIHSKHEEFLLKKKNVFENLKDVPVLIINANDEFEQDSQQFAQHVKRVQEFLSNL